MRIQSVAGGDTRRSLYVPVGTYSSSINSTWFNSVGRRNGSTILFAEKVSGRDGASSVVMAATTNVVATPAAALTALSLIHI